MAALVQLQIEGRLASGAHQKEANPMLRHTKIGAIDDMWCDHVAERRHCL
ncbi:hypothetical protein PSHI_06450 [Pseudomonas sp. URMO17WK12:I11]|nr:hypothetical protein PSHI_06450 [Pseudomonas sp. URMO17WK12:I11]